MMSVLEKMSIARASLATVRQFTSTGCQSFVRYIERDISIRIVHKEPFLHLEHVNPSCVILSEECINEIGGIAIVSGTLVVMLCRYKKELLLTEINENLRCLRYLKHK